jgi:hypothetical protein
MSAIYPYRNIPQYPNKQKALWEPRPGLDTVARKQVSAPARYQTLIIWPTNSAFFIYEGLSKSSWTDSITKYMLIIVAGNCYP